jgi:hypothetical protein
MFVALCVELRAIHRRRLYFRVLGHCQNIVGVLSCVPRRKRFSFIAWAPVRGKAFELVESQYAGVPKNGYG